MKKRKTLCALTSGLLAVLLLAGCARDPAVMPDSTESESESTTTAAAEPETTPLELVRDGKTEYSIVYPDSPSSEELNASVQLQTLFRSKLGVRIESDTDYTIREGQPEKRILLGATCAAESEEAYRDLQYHAFRIAVKGSNLCIAAYSEDGWLAALEWMDNTLFGGATESDGKKSVTVNITEVTGGNREYPIKSWTIAGQALNAYRLIWATEDQQSIAETLRETLAEQTGWVLPVFRDTETEPSDYEILLGETNRAESQAVAAPAALTYVVRVVNGKAVIKTGGEHSSEKLAGTLVDLLAADTGSVVMGKNFSESGDYFDDPYDISVSAGTDLRIMDANILAEYESWNGKIPVAKRKEILFAAIDFYRPTVIGLQEVSPQWYDAFETYSGWDKWDVLKIKNPNKSSEYVFSTVAWRTDLYTLVDSGMTYYSAYNNAHCRCITWAVLEVRATGKRFCFVSTHWDGTDSDKTMQQVAELTAFVNEMAKTYPVMTMGDFNSNESSRAWKQYVPAIDSNDAKFTAKTRLNNIGSWHDLGINTPSVNSCDHITITKNITCLKFETLIHNEQIWGSDHSWLIADLKFN